MAASKRLSPSPTGDGSTRERVVDNPYRTVKLIGRGGFSRVYEAQDPEGQTVALKKSCITEKVERPMLRHEACALYLLAAIDLLGRPLSDERQDVYDVLLLIDQMLETLRHLHSRFIVHCDIKPQNFMLGTGPNVGRVYLIDYGFARYYRDPNSGAHYPLQQTGRLIGTVHYASINAHRGFSLFPRDDMESLAYTIVSLLKGSLPWKRCTAGTLKHAENRIREKKQSWTGARLCAGLPKEFGEFVDYVHELDYQEPPDYERWQRVFRRLSHHLRTSPVEVLSLISDLTNRNQTPSQPLVLPTLPKIIRETPPVTKGQYVLVQLLPHLTIEDGTDDSVDWSRWHDPSLTIGQWAFPRRPALILDVTPMSDRRGAFLVSLLPLLHHPGKLDLDEEKRFILLGRRPTPPHERVIVPSPEWSMSNIYHFAPPRAFRVWLEPDQLPVDTHWCLNSVQFERLQQFLSVDYPLPKSRNTQIIIAAIDDIRRRHDVPLFARISPFTDAVASANYISWTGPQGLVGEILLLGQRVSADDGCPSSDETNGIVRAYDKFHAKSTWEAAQEVSIEDLLGDEQAIVKAGIPVMRLVPVEFDSDIYNEDESMQ